MTRIAILLVALSSLLVTMQCKMNQKKASELTVEVSNPAPIAVTDAAVKIPWTVISEKLPQANQQNMAVYLHGKEIASQWITTGKNAPYLLTLVNINEEASTTLLVKERGTDEIIPEFTKRTYAELSVKEGGHWEYITKKNGNQQYEYQGGEFKNIESLKVPKEHTDHSFYIRYEGPGWESDKVGYRLYLDWRNAVDIFGKLTPEMVLHKAGLDGFESYHEPAEWGQDIFKVAETLGIGSIGYWNGEKAVRVETTDSVECTVTINGILKSEIETNYFGWQTGETKWNLKAKTSILAGSRLSKQYLETTDQTPLLCTGIIKHKGIDAFTNQDKTHSEWLYLATYGYQSLANDSLGLAVIVNKKYLNEITQDPLNHILVLEPKDHAVKYYFLAAWEKEPNGIKNRAEFVAYLENLMLTFNQPLQITFN
ncbi:MAG: DUF4861 family protein [Salinivirgaceae bacterium]